MSCRDSDFLLYLTDPPPNFSTHKNDNLFDKSAIELTLIIREVLLMYLGRMRITAMSAIQSVMKANKQ